MKYKYLITRLLPEKEYIGIVDSRQIAEMLVEGLKSKIAEDALIIEEIPHLTHLSDWSEIIDNL